MLIVRHLNRQAYDTVWGEMKQFTAMRDDHTPDELWLLEHDPVYTQGQAGKPEHVLNPQNIPLVQTDRGGQVTYHGPGQLVAYTLIDIRRRHMGIRTLVCQLERVLLLTLKHFKVMAETRTGAPGIYVQNKKIASIGLRVKNGCSYHGISLNVAMDLTPFTGINPCGYAHLEMTQLQDFIENISVKEASEQLTQDFLTIFGH